MEQPNDADVTMTRPGHPVAAARRRLLDAAEDGSLATICATRRVRLMTLFGSAARGAAEPGDLDVAVLFEQTRGELLGLVTDLVELTGTTDVDVMDLRRASAVARVRALAHGALVLHEDTPGLFTRNQMGAITLAADFAPMRRQQLLTMAGR